MLNSFESKVLRTIRDHRMLDVGEHVLVAVSGGADSMALLLCLRRLAPVLRLRLTVAHLNHGLRGAESDGDEEFVAESCRNLEIEFVSKGIAIQRLGGNLEDVARQVRYAFLHKTAAEVGARKIAVGHTLNDQAETVLLRLLRGSGPEGLSGIHPVVDGVLVRPLFDCTRSEIVAFLNRAGFTYREDSTNKNTEIRRNRVRSELIPYLQTNFNPRVVETLAAEADLAREVSEYLAARSSEAYGRIHTHTASGIAVPVAVLEALGPALSRLVVREAIKDCLGSLKGITSLHVRDVLRLCGFGQSGRYIELPKGAVVRREFESLVFQTVRREQRESFCYELPIPGCCRVEEAGVEFVATLEPYENENPGVASPDRALLDSRRLPDVLSVRSRRQGDRYGGPGGRKVKKMLIDSKIPISDRERLPLIVAGNAVVWIPGFRPAKRFMAPPGCGRCLVVRVVRYDRGDTQELKNPKESRNQQHNPSI